MSSPLGWLLGAPQDQPTCKVVAPGEIEIHWYASPAPEPGERCLCGKRIKRNEEES